MQILFTPLVGALTLSAVVGASAQSLDRTGSLFSPCLEWKVEYADHAGNPFDVEGTAVFAHAASRETLTTGMFHEGGNAWKFRFIGTRTGKWTFITRSSVAALNGGTGSVVRPAQHLFRRDVPTAGETPALPGQISRVKKRSPPPSRGTK